jgi:nucleotide-binding universal stress UspA family protein
MVRVSPPFTNPESNADGLRVLVALDDSEQAQRVVAYVGLLAATAPGQIKLIRATDIDEAAIFDSLPENARRLRESGLSVEWRVVPGIDAVSAIVAEARAWDPDLIAMSTTKWSGVDRWLNGSVSQDVVRAASVPVLVVPRDWERPVPHSRPPRILVPLDGSALAERSLGLAVRLADLMSAEVIVMRPIESYAQRAGAEAYVREIGATLESAVPHRNVVARVVTGRPDATILDTARDMDVNAIVMTTRGHRNADRMRAGKTAAGVVDNAHSPLFLV